MELKVLFSEDPAFVIRRADKFPRKVKENV
jgi:hypothetical protein